MARSRTAHLVKPMQEVMLDATQIWAPQQGPQLLATLCPVKMILFGGSRGGGKTDCAIGKQIYGALRYGPDWNGLFIRKSYKYFADIRRRLGQLIRAGLPAELVGPQQGTNYLRFKSGANITLTVVESIEKAEFFQGQSFTSVSIEEACQFSYIDPMIEMLKGCLRSAAGIPTQMFLTANPGGPGHSQVKARFMPKGVKPGQIVTDDTGMTSVFIPSSVEDNKILCENDPDYVNNLRSIKDPALRKAWLEGDWDVVLGGYFGDVWNPYKHVVPQFKPPMHWPRVVSMDWGSATPFSINWFAIADGETSVPLRGVHKVFPKGAMIQFQEWYGVQKNTVSGRIEANVGIRMQSSDVGTRMLDLESRMNLLGRTTLIDRVADPSIFAEKDGPSIAEKFCDAGVVWRRGENKRISGWDTMRYMLHGRLLSQTFKDVELDDGTVERVVDTEEREPLLYFTENCEHIIRTLPEQERDMADWEDIDCFVAGTKIRTPGGEVEIQDVNVGDVVETPLGPRPVLKSFCSGEARTFALKFSDGTVLEGTGQHKIMTENGLLPLCLITSDIVVEKHGGLKLWEQNQCFIEGFGLQDATVETIGRHIRELLKSMDLVPFCFTELSMSQNAERYPLDFISTTLMAMPTITIFQIWNSLLRVIMLDCTMKSELRRVTVPDKARRLLPGELQKKVGLNFQKMLGLCTRILPKENLRALIVASLLEQGIREPFCAKVVDQKESLQGRERDICSMSAKFVGKSILDTESQTQKWGSLVAMSVGGCSEGAELKKVYSLEVEQSRLYYANGVLASNTQGEDHGVDSVRYAVMSRPSSGIKLSDLTRPAMQTECARDIAEATMSQGLRIPEDGLTRPQGAGGAGAWDDHIAGQNAYIAR